MSCARARPDWLAEAGRLRAERVRAERVLVRYGRRRLLLDTESGEARPTRTRDGRLPVLPHASTWPAPDLELLEAGRIDPGELHPLVAAALAPGFPAKAEPASVPAQGPRIVECRGAAHRIALVGGVLTALDHDPAQLRREELLAALGGPPLPCLRAIDDCHRHPESLDDIRARLDHGDTAGALAAVEDLIGPDALLRAGALRDALEAAAHQSIRHGLYRNGLTNF